MIKTWEWLQGKKSYIAAIGLAIYGVVDFLEGKPDEGFEKIMAALAVFGLRQAIKTERKKVEKKIEEPYKATGERDY